MKPFKLKCGCQVTADDKIVLMCHDHQVGFDERHKAAMQYHLQERDYVLQSEASDGVEL